MNENKENPVVQEDSNLLNELENDSCNEVFDIDPNLNNELNDQNVSQNQNDILPEIIQTEGYSNNETKLLSYRRLSLLNNA